MKFDELKSKMNTLLDGYDTSTCGLVLTHMLALAIAHRANKLQQKYTEQIEEELGQVMDRWVK